MRKTAIVEPMPQSCVTRKCCSMAVPKVITRFPAIRRVIMNRDNAGMKTARQPAFTPLNVKGKTTLRKVAHDDAPKSRAAATRDGFSSSSTLNIGRIIYGMKMYTATNMKLKSVNRICLVPIPTISKKELIGP